MRRRIGFYVHHHGAGHASRTRAVIDRLSVPATVLTSAPLSGDTFYGTDVVRLPLDTGKPETDADVGIPPQLHYAPVGVAGLRDRIALIARFLAEAEPALLVVDVSVEVAQLARIAGVPTVVVRQNGVRWDPPHLAAYLGSAGLLAPFGPELEEPDVPDRVRQRTFYAGGLSRRPTSAPDRAAMRRALGWTDDERAVLVLLGAGGGGPHQDDIDAAAEATPTDRWFVVGDPGRVGSLAAGAGWVDDPRPFLEAADVVVGSGGHNTVMEVAAAARPFVCVPQDRPFDEQRRKAARLRDLDVAEVCEHWPAAEAWPATLDRATARGGAGLARLTALDGAQRAADWLTSLSGKFVA